MNCADNRRELLSRLSSVFQRDLITAKARYYKTSNEYAEFSQAMGLPQQRERITVDGLGTIKNTPKSSDYFTGKSSETLEKSGESGIISANRPLEINIQLFARSSNDYPTVYLPKAEYAHVMSELETNITLEQRNKKVFRKAIGDYYYTVENNGSGDYRIIRKTEIE